MIEVDFIADLIQSFLVEHGRSFLVDLHYDCLPKHLVIVAMLDISTDCRPGLCRILVAMFLKVGLVHFRGAGLGRSGSSLRFIRSIVMWRLVRSRLKNHLWTGASSAQTPPVSWFFRSV